MSKSLQPTYSQAKLAACDATRTDPDYLKACATTLMVQDCPSDEDMDDALSLIERAETGKAVRS